MEEKLNKTKLKYNMCTSRRITIQHEIDENLHKKLHLSNLNFHKYQQELFNKKMNNFRKNLEHIQPYIIPDDINNEQQFLMIPNCFTRIKNHFHLLNFPLKTEKRLLCQVPSYNKSNKNISIQQFPYILEKNSNEINQCIKRISYYQSRPSINYSCRSKIDNHFLNSNTFEDEIFQSFINQHLFDEKEKQLENNKRKDFLLKEFDELKHTIDDPHSTYSVLAALSRAILYLDSGIK